MCWIPRVRSANTCVRMNGIENNNSNDIWTLLSEVI